MNEQIHSFTVLDLHKSYWQIPLSDNFKRGNSVLDNIKDFQLPNNQCRFAINGRCNKASLEFTELNLRSVTNEPYVKIRRFKWFLSDANLAMITFHNKLKLFDNTF